jgi:hypothetical protein
MIDYSIIRDFAADKHESVNQYYDTRYSYLLHLDLVLYSAYVLGQRCIILCDNFDIDSIASIIYLHDIFDCHNVRYSDIVKISSTTVAEAVLTLTEPVGRNRKESHNIDYFSNIAINNTACFVKICDIYANKMYSMYTGNKSMQKAYESDIDLFSSCLSESYFKKFLVHVKNAELTENFKSEITRLRVVNEV